jgi:hypothetical protein
LDELEAMVVGLKPAEGVSQDTLKNALVKNGLPWVDTTYAYQAVASEKRNLAEDAADDTNNRLSKVVTNIAAAWMDIEYRKSRVKAA